MLAGSVSTDRINDLIEKRIRALTPLPLRLELWDGRLFDFGTEPKVRINIKTPGALRHFAQPSLASLGEAYAEGEIEIKGCMRSAMQIAETLSQETQYKSSKFIFPNLRRRTPKSDTQAVRYHYDVSNEFYELWLDRQMVYSCAYFKTGTEDIHQAQEQKLDHICRKLQLKKGDRLLDVGCGWGGLIIWAARNYGVRAVGITLSEKQYLLAQKRIQEAGLENRCEVKLKDYRDLEDEGTFDKIASIGMFEHVGIKNLPLYFRVLQERLREGGFMLNHGITSGDVAGYTKSFGGGEFIDRYVFPDGELPHLSLALQRMEEQKLEVIDVESLRPHYAKTLWHWYQRFTNNEANARAFAGDKMFRIWNVYLPGCAHAFERGWVSIHQILAVKNTLGRLTNAPLTREHLYV